MAAALGVALLGLLPFFADNFVPLDGGWYLVAILAYLTGLSGAAIALFARGHAPGWPWVRLGAGAMASAGLFWIVLDWGDGAAWEPETSSRSWERSSSPRPPAA